MSLVYYAEEMTELYESPRYKSNSLPSLNSSTASCQLEGVLRGDIDVARKIVPFDSTMSSESPGLVCAFISSQRRNINHLYSNSSSNTIRHGL